MKTYLNAKERIYRYEVPVDDQLHVVEISGDPLFVACRNLTVVEFWARANQVVIPRKFVVVGTGHPIPVDVTYWGTALAPSGLVWHLMEQL